MIQYKNPEFINRLKQLIGNDPPFSWAARVGISKGAFSRIWHEGTLPSTEMLIRISTMTGCSLNWLLLGEGTTQIDNSTSFPYPIAQLESVEMAAELSAFEAHSPTNLSFADPSNIAGFNRDWIHHEFLTQPENLLICRVTDNGMEPALHIGDLVMVNKDNSLLGIDGIYLVKINDKLTTKRIQFLPNKKLEIISDNAKYKPFSRDIDEQDEFSIVGRVVWISKKI